MTTLKIKKGSYSQTEEWIMKEYGSWEDHDNTKDHVCAIVQRENATKSSFMFITEEEARELLVSAEYQYSAGWDGWDNPKKQVKEISLFNTARSGCIYYGSFRKDRSAYFKKYLDENVLLSTHSKNIDKFRNAGTTSNVGSRINWSGEGLFPYKQSLYIEDEKTHTHYNYLANRFYEALNYDCTPIFSNECRKTVELSGYKITDEYFISSSKDLIHKEYLTCLQEWHDMASEEKQDALNQIYKIIL